MDATLPPGWPDPVRPPGAPDWEQSAVAWLFDLVRRLMWTPPEPRDADTVAAALRAGGAREWQVELSCDLLVDALDRA